MDKLEIRDKIEKYLMYYNSFDCDSILELLEEDIVFKNIVSDEINIETNGKNQFKNLFLKASSIFSSQTQTMITIAVEENTASVEIFFDGTIKNDTDTGLFKGDEVRIEGYTEFEFSDSGLIKTITDYSRN